jgi:hypothetical protein
LLKSTQLISGKPGFKFKSGDLSFGENDGLENFKPLRCKIYENIGQNMKKNPFKAQLRLYENKGDLLGLKIKEKLKSKGINKQTLADLWAPALAGHKEDGAVMASGQHAAEG